MKIPILKNAPKKISPQKINPKEIVPYESHPLLTVSSPQK